MIDSPEVEKEVKRLLRADTFAVNVCILISLCCKQYNYVSYCKHYYLLQNQRSCLITECFLCGCVVVLSLLILCVCVCARRYSFLNCEQPSELSVMTNKMTPRGEY